MAELLLKAKPHWMDALTAGEVEKLSPEARAGYEARSQIGDIIVVRPDGWRWGREECLPNFIVVKAPSFSFEQARRYEESLQDLTNIENPVLLKTRKYRVPPAAVSGLVLQARSEMTVTPAQAAAFQASIIVKVK